MSISTSGLSKARSKFTIYWISKGAYKKVTVHLGLSVSQITATLHLGLSVPQDLTTVIIQVF